MYEGLRFTRDNKVTLIGTGSRILTTLSQTLPQLPSRTAPGCRIASSRALCSELPEGLIETDHIRNHPLPFPSPLCNIPKQVTVKQRHPTPYSTSILEMREVLGAMPS